MDKRAVIFAVSVFLASSVLVVFCCHMAARDQSRTNTIITEQGYQAGWAGQPPSCCPYSDGWGEKPGCRQTWMVAWSKGDAAKKQK